MVQRVRVEGVVWGQRQATLLYSHQSLLVMKEKKLCSLSQAVAIFCFLRQTWSAIRAAPAFFKIWLFSAPARKSLLS